MKHTDTLLGIHRGQTEEVADANERQRRATHIQTRLRLVQSLAQSDGWSLFISELRNEKAQLLKLLESSTEPTTLAKVAGSLLVVESFLDWPAYMARELDAEAKELVKG